MSEARQPALPATSELRKRLHLLWMLLRRDLLLKYRGSVLGIGWSFLYPLLLLAIFSLVTTPLLGARWPNSHPAGPSAAFSIYCGLIIFTPISEVLSGAPRLIHGYVSYVKKIIFPTELLPLMTVMSATAHALINLLILLLALALFSSLHATLLLLPVVLLPAFLLACGIAWLLAAAGVFVRDLVHVMPVLTQVLLFLSPVFYPAEIIPESWRFLYRLNPLTPIIENLRRITVYGQLPDWNSLMVSFFVAASVIAIGYKLFHRTREEFADVL